MFLVMGLTEKAPREGIERGQTAHETRDETYTSPRGLSSNPMS